MFRFKIGKSYWVIGGLLFKVLSRSKDEVWGSIYFEDLETKPFRKKIFIRKNEEVIILKDVVICGAKYFLRG